MADLAIVEAEQAYKFGEVKAKADFETGYLNLKTTVRDATHTLEIQETCLEFAQIEQAKGF